MQLKLLLFSISFLVSFLLSEIILNFVIDTYQVESRYDSLKTAEIGNGSYTQKNRHEDIYEIYQNNPEQLEIVTVGDSFTNGGNVAWNETYPFHLFLNLQQKNTVFNMGICEDFTAGSYVRIKNKLNGNSTNDKTTSQKLFVLLVGAADIFMRPDTINLQNKYDVAMKNGKIEFQKIDFKENTQLNWIQKTKTYKLMSYLFLLSKKKLLQLYYSNSSELIHFNQDCFKLSGPSREQCLAQDYQAVAQQLTPATGKAQLKNLVRSLIAMNNKTNASEYQMASDLFHLGQTLPQIIHIPEYIYNLVTYTISQSQLSLELDIIPFLQKTYESPQSQSDFVTHRNFDLNETLAAVNEWGQAFNSKKEKQQRELQNIIDLIKAHDQKLILLTYPLNYKDLNNSIRNLAQKNNIPLVDLELLFNQKIKAGIEVSALIDDWEHCTPLGYKIIADAVHEKIQNLDLK